MGTAASVEETSSIRWKVTPAGVYLGALLFVFAWFFAHVISLPVGISYDGHVYIDLADILGTGRFPHDWNPARTPLFPAALKLSFAAFGRQPLAAIAVSAIAGLVGILVAGAMVKSLAGELAGATVLVVLSLAPTFVAYQHFVLTETGSFCFLAILTALSMWLPRDYAGRWRKAAGLALFLALGFYWRQNLLSLAPWLATLHLITGWRSADKRLNLRAGLGANWAVVAQAALIVFAPYLLSRPWQPYTNEAGLRDIMLRFGIVKQALPDPRDPLVGPEADDYSKAIQASLFQGHLYSGLRADLASQLSNKMFSGVQTESASAQFIHLVRKYPQRYLAGVGRTVCLFAGAKGLQDENEIFRGQILSPTFIGSKISEGPEPVYSLNKDDFLQRTKSSWVQAILRLLQDVYDHVLPVGFLTLLAGILIAVWTRNWRLFAFSSIPLLYVLPYAVTLSSVDRYALPMQPFALLAPLVVVLAVVQRTSPVNFSKMAYAAPR